MVATVATEAKNANLVAEYSHRWHAISEFITLLHALILGCLSACIRPAGPAIIGSRCLVWRMPSSREDGSGGMALAVFISALFHVRFQYLYNNLCCS
jgi:hypothetical protein